MSCIYCRYGGITWCGNCKNTTKSPVKNPSADTINPKNLKTNPVATKRATQSATTRTIKAGGGYMNTTTDRPKDNWSDESVSKFSGTFGSTSNALSW